MPTLNFILILLAAFLAVFWEAAFPVFRHWLGAQVNLLPALVVYAALATDLFTLTALCVFGGLLFDALSANPLGVTILPLFVVGLLIHLQREFIVRDQTFVHFVLGMTASAAAAGLTVLLLLTMGQAPLLGWGSLWQWTVMSIGGGIATPIFFQLFGLFDTTLNYRRITETSFRPDREIRRGRK